MLRAGWPLSAPYDDLCQELGEGATATVRLMRHAASGELAAVKLIERGATVGASVERELLYHRRLSLSGCAHIIALKEVFLTPSHLAVALELGAGGTLFDWVQAQGRLSEAQARAAFTQLVQGLAHCHAQGVTHGDIKLENALMCQPPGAPPLVKLCDFGLARDAATPHCFADAPTLGTPAYVAPEVLSGRPYDGRAADVWACGVLLYTMLEGRYPFEDPADPDSATLMLQHIMEGRYSIPRDPPLSPACIDLVRGMLMRDPAQRLALDAVQRHPWCAPEAGDGASAATPAASQPVGPAQSEDEVRALVAAARLPGDAKGASTGSLQASEQTHVGWAGMDAAGSACIDDALEEECSLPGPC